MRALLIAAAGLAVAACSSNGRTQNGDASSEVHGDGANDTVRTDTVTSDVRTDTTVLDVRGTDGPIDAPQSDLAERDAITPDVPSIDVTRDVSAIDTGTRDVSTMDSFDAPTTDTSVHDAPVTDTTSDATPPDGGPVRIPIDHVIIIVKENHSFDNYFGSFPGAEGTSVAQTSTGPYTVQEPPLQLTRDLCHEHNCALTDWDQGAMDGWDTADTQNQSDHLAYDQYTESDIPNYWQYARHFVLADHFHSSMLGPSFPGHSFALSAQSGWAIGNPTQLNPWGCDDGSGTTIDILQNGTCTVQSVFPCFDYPTIPDVLPSSVTWRFYGSTLPSTSFPFLPEVWSMFDSINHIRNGPQWNNVVDASSFDSDVQSGSLPNIVWLVDQDTNSEHPPLNICQGENWSVGHINAVMNSPYWSRTAILMLWDDFGGWYDHVAPPVQYGCDAMHPYGLGFRLPLIIVSPYAKPGYVMHGLAQQASVVKFLETVFGLPSLASMDPAAQDGPGTSDLTDAFDWTQTQNAPLVLSQRSCLGQR